MKRRKTFETQIDKISNMRAAIEQQCMTIEDAALSADMVKAMQIGGLSLRELQQGMYP
jgi:charged multivesicular body protein 4